MSVTLDRRQTAIGVLAGFALGSSGASLAQDTPGVRRTTFRSRGRDQFVIVMDPAGDGDLTGAAILLLHGSGGLRASFAQFYRQAVVLTRRGATVVMPSWLSDAPDAPQSDDVAWWAETVTDAANWMAALPGVDPMRLGAMGYSRGGYLAAEVAVQRTAIRAVVGVASAGNVEPADILRRPEVLLIHADGDPVIPPERTRRWERILNAAGVPVRRIALRWSDHAFDTETWASIFATAADFFVRTLSASAAPSSAR